MCGITAILDPAGASVQSLLAMTATVRHRGPDSEGYLVATGRSWQTLHGPDTQAHCIESDVPFRARLAPASAEAAGTGTVLLGHRRLSIIDLTASGHQPMSHADGRYWITFNGEIYNHVELRAELAAHGHVLVGHSDTEVILAGYRQWGESVLERLRGMFAFVLVDLVAQTFLAARDRFGIKPLYLYRARSGGVALASEIKAFTVLPDWRASANGPRLYDFLAHGILDHTDQTMFSAVDQVPPGGVLAGSLGDPARATLRIWWSLDRRAGAREIPLDVAARELRDLLEQSVSEHLRADVPVGSCLSGGLDSSALFCLMAQQVEAQQMSQPLVAFTAVSSDPLLDEREWARLVVAQTGAEQHEVEPHLRDLDRDLDRITWHMDEPFGSTSILAQWCVFRLAREHGQKVLLDGQGADEQLAGYKAYQAWRLFELVRDRRPVRAMAELRSLHRRDPLLARQSAMLLAFLVAPPAWGSRVATRRGLGGQGYRSWLDGPRLDCPAEPVTGVLDRGLGGVAGLTRDQLTRSSLPMLLHYEDRDSMAHSIEARVPFLDHRVVEFTTSLQTELLLKDGVTKRVLREALRGVVPEATRARVDKIGFATAEEDWMRSDPGWVRDRVRHSIEVLDGAVRPTVLADVDAVLAGQRPFDYSIWRLVSAGSWADRFDVRI